MRWIYFIEGLFFLVCSIPALKFGGLSAMLCVSIAGTLSWSFAFSFQRTRGLFGLSLHELGINWVSPNFKLAVCLAIAGGIVGYLTFTMSPLLQLIYGSGTILIAGSVLLPRLGVDSSIKHEMRRRMPGFISRLLIGSRPG